MSTVRIFDIAFKNASWVYDWPHLGIKMEKTMSRKTYSRCCLFPAAQDYGDDVGVLISKGSKLGG